MLSQIINYVEINTKLGTAGQPERSQFHEIKEAGYEIVINLVPLSSPDALPDEESIVTALGLEYIHIPIIWTEPTRQNFNQFSVALDRNRERKVFAHCVLNMRVSAFIFLYQVLRVGIPEEEARKPMHEIWEPNPTWESFISEVIDAYRTTGI